MAETKAAFRRRVGRLARVLAATATQSAGTSTTGTAVALLDTFPGDDDMNNCVVYDVTQAEWRRVSDWVATTFTYTVNRAFTATTATHAIEVYKGFTPSDIDNALQLALTEVYPYLCALIEDTSLTVSSQVYTYAIPSTIREMTRMLGCKVEAIIITTGTGHPVQDIPRWDARKTRTAAGVEAHTLQLFNLSGLVGNVLRLTGIGHLTFPATDATSIPLNEDGLTLLAYKTAEILWRNALESDGTDIQRAEAKAQQYKALYDAYKDVFGDMLKPVKVNDLTFGGFGPLALAQNADPA